eukprot:3939922-Rhodomonas_salina.1
MEERINPRERPSTHQRTTENSSNARSHTTCPGPRGPTPELASPATSMTGAGVLVSDVGGAFVVGGAGTGTSVTVILAPVTLESGAVA